MLRRRPAPAGNLPRIALQAIAGAVLLTALLLFGGALYAYSAYTSIAESLEPRLGALESRTVFQTSRIYDRNGELLYEFFDTGRRTRVALADIDPLVISATIAIEDQTFYENSGVDYEGLLRSVYLLLATGEEQGGGSTITMQTVKGIVLTDEERAFENRYERKLTEIVLAQSLTDRYSKDEILELYLNEIYYGNLAYGIEAAADAYFGISARDLSLAQASLLAGLPQLPTFYDPIQYLDNNRLPGVRLAPGWLTPDYQLPDEVSPPRARQVAVLRQMVRLGYISNDEAVRAAREELVFKSQEVPINAPHFVFYVRRLLEERYGAQFVAGGGLRIYTTIDLSLQRMVQEKASERIEELKQRNIHNAAVVVMQPNTGQILAMVGSIDYNKVEATTTPGEEGNVIDGQVNVTTRERQPGSALKPFTYLAAMEQGWTPETVIWDVPTKFPLTSAGTEFYEPQNYNGRWNGPVRIRTALANSLNMPAVLALRYAGIDYTLDLLDRLGVKSSLKRGSEFYGLALTLGGGEVTPLELTTAYNTLASGGRYYPPVAILRVEGPDGQVIEEFAPYRAPQVVDAALVGIITDMLSDDSARAPIWGLNSKLKLSRPSAVKTGTTNDWRDAWTVGYTPYVTVGVWSGNNNNEPTARVESLSGGGIIWHNVMEAIFTDERLNRLLAEPYDGVLPLEFTRPEGLEVRPICRIPSPFGNYSEELFTVRMLQGKSSATPTPEPETGRPVGDCQLYRQMDVVLLPGATAQITDTSAASAAFCLPDPSMVYPEELRTRISVWDVPPPDPDIEVQYRWSWGSAEGGLVSGLADQLTVCPAGLGAPPKPPPPPGGIEMPNLRGYGENQARDILRGLGITSVYVDYQDRARAGAEYDRLPDYAVISTLPAPGDYWVPGTTVVLGIRAPDPSLPAPTPAPAPPPAPPPTTPPVQPTPRIEGG